jgi:hypothetical protein
MGASLPVVDLGVSPRGTSAVAVAVTCGYSHTCVLLDTEKVKCWCVPLKKKRLLTGSYYIVSVFFFG